MSFVPHTQQEIEAMLSAIGVEQVEQLFDEIHASLRAPELEKIPQALSEHALKRHVSDLNKRNSHGLCFIGAGSYEHHIPAAVWDIASRGEFMTAYTPYQAEASQGSLQLIYEFQSMMASLTGMDASNASLYDGASALAEAVLMAIRSQKRNKSRRVLVLGHINPSYLACLKTIVTSQGIEIVNVPYDQETGLVDLDQVTKQQDFNSLVIQQPTFFGNLEQVDALTDWAHAQQALVIACVNPMSLAIIKEPGSWGQAGADIVCGEGQPFGVPMNSGGPYFGLLCCRQALVRQMPGRIVGRTLDQTGKKGFTLTLQAREQHIRRGKATSNICTNQGLLVTAATIYLSLLGEVGLQRVAKASMHQAHVLAEALTSIDGVDLVFNQARFHEFVLRLPQSAQTVLQRLDKVGIQGGFDLSKDFPDLENCILVCATETKNQQDIDYYRQQLAKVLA